MKNKRLSKNKVPIVCAFRMMNGIYSPFIQRYKSLLDDSDKLEFENYLDRSIENSNHKNIQFFVDYNKTYTLNKISRVVVHLYNDYHKEFNDNLFGALSKLFSTIKSDIKK